MGKNKIATYTVIILLAVIVLFVIYLNINSNNQTSKENKIRVIDGDTFVYNNETIRLICVNTPEVDEEGYAEAMIFLSNSLYGNELRIDRHGEDKYNRTLAYVYINGMNISVNEEIVDKGYGELFPYGDESCEGMK
ncbi:MAG: thermonuclease family protein [Nanoarchaeota archaeon]